MFYKKHGIETENKISVQRPFRVFIDSTYIFPALNVDIIEGWNKKDLNKLISKVKSGEILLYYCDLSLFELYTKCMRLINQHVLNVSISSIQEGLDGIINCPDLQKIDWYNHNYDSNFVLNLKAIHNDSIDCQIFYLAVLLGQCFATFDSTFIRRIKETPRILDYIRDINPNFMIWSGNLKGGYKRLLD